MAEATLTTIPIYHREKRPHLDELGPDEIACSYCGAKCCKYFALPIETPDCWEDFEYIRWYLLHDRATVFIEDDTWYLLVHNRCKCLGEDNLCREYETRPQICRDYKTKDCEYEDESVYDHYWETPQQVAEYAEAVLGPRKGQGFRGPKPK